MATDLTSADSPVGSPAATVEVGARGTAARTAVSAAIPSVDLWGMPLHSLSLARCAAEIVARAARGEGGWVVTPNLDILRRYARSETFRTLVASSTLNVADGAPLVWASRIKGSPLPGRVNGTDLMCRLATAAAEAGLSVYFLGGNPGAAEEAANVLQRRNPGLRIAGCDCPPYGFESDWAQIAAIGERVIAARPNIVFVGLGSPKQDVVINALRSSLPSAWWIGVGVSFSFVSGEISRAPAWAQHHGLEWFFRLVSEPRRLARRYLVQGIPFAARTMLHALWGRVAAGGARAKVRDEPLSRGGPC